MLFESGCPDRPPLFLFTWKDANGRSTSPRNATSRKPAFEQRIARIVEPVANDLGYALVRVKITQENGLTLQIMAEDANGRFTIADCETLSQGPLAGARRRGSDRPRISLSKCLSPGIDRPLVRAPRFRGLYRP